MDIDYMKQLGKYEQLDLGIKIAVTGHLASFDKGGKPYSLHPLYLMFQLMYDPQRATIAVLHDWLEDVWIPQEKATHQSFQQALDSGIQYLRDEGFSERVTSALILLTHNPDDPYELYIEKICGNLDAICVKRKDIAHNSDVTRLKGIREKDLLRIEKYHRAFIRLGEAKQDFKR